MNDVKVNLRVIYGDLLIKIGQNDDKVVVLDAEVSNSTGSAKFKEVFPDRFIECFIAEQNMISVATGLSSTSLKPFVSTFSAFLSRCFDQIRMAQYCNCSINIIGTHCGVSIGQDGPSQMALEDIAMFRSIQNSLVFYPSDDYAFEKILKLMLKSDNQIKYCRVTRGDLKKIYSENESFEIGGNNLVLGSKDEPADICLIAAGVTLNEAIIAAEKYKTEINSNIEISVIDLYCIKPINVDMLIDNISGAKKLIVIEDHNFEGGMHSAICQILMQNTHKLSNNIEIIESLSVTKIPRSGTPEELLAYMEIDSDAILKEMKNII